MAGHSAINAESEVNYAKDALNSGLNALSAAVKIAKNLAFGSQEMLERIAVFEWSYQIKGDHLATSDGDRYSKLIASEQPLQREILSSVERDFVNDPSVRQKVVVSLDNASENIPLEERRSYIYVYTRHGNEIRAQSIETFADPNLVRGLLRQLGCDDTIKAVEGGKILIEPTAIRNVREEISLKRISAETRALSKSGGGSERTRDLHDRIAWYMDNRELVIKARQDETNRIATSIMAQGAERFLEGVRDQANNLNRAIVGGQALAQSLFREENRGRDLPREFVQVYRPEGLSVQGAHKGTLNPIQLDQVNVVGWGNMARWGELLGFSIPTQPHGVRPLAQATDKTISGGAQRRVAEQRSAHHQVRESQTSNVAGVNYSAVRRERGGQSRFEVSVATAPSPSQPRGGSIKLQPLSPPSRAENSLANQVRQSKVTVKRTEASLRSSAVINERRRGDTPTLGTKAAVAVRQMKDALRAAALKGGRVVAIKRAPEKFLSIPQARALLSRIVGRAGVVIRERAQQRNLGRPHARKEVKLARVSTRLTQAGRTRTVVATALRRLSQLPRALAQQARPGVPQVRMPRTLRFRSSLRSLKALVRIRDRVQGGRRYARQPALSSRAGRSFSLLTRRMIKLAISPRNVYRSRGRSRLQPSGVRLRAQPKRLQLAFVRRAFRHVRSSMRSIKRSVVGRPSRFVEVRRVRATNVHDSNRATLLFVELLLRQLRSFRIRLWSVGGVRPPEEALSTQRVDVVGALDAERISRELPVMMPRVLQADLEIGGSPDNEDVRDDLSEDDHSSEGLLTFVAAEPKWELSILTARQVDSSGSDTPRESHAA
jgi:hypothetical protein